VIEVKQNDPKWCTIPMAHVDVLIFGLVFSLLGYLKASESNEKTVNQNARFAILSWALDFESP